MDGSAKETNKDRSQIFIVLCIFDLIALVGALSTFFFKQENVICKNRFYKLIVNQFVKTSICSQSGLHLFQLNILKSLKQIQNYFFVTLVLDTIYNDEEMEHVLQLCILLARQTFIFQKFQFLVQNSFDFGDVRNDVLIQFLHKLCFLVLEKNVIVFLINRNRRPKNIRNTFRFNRLT